MPGKSDFEKASFGGKEKKGEKRARGKGEEEVLTCHYLIGILIFVIF